MLRQLLFIFIALTLALSSVAQTTDSSRFFIAELEVSYLLDYTAPITDVDGEAALFSHMDRPHVSVTLTKGMERKASYLSLRLGYHRHKVEQSVSRLGGFQDTIVGELANEEETTKRFLLDAEVGKLFFLSKGAFTFSYGAGVCLSIAEMGQNFKTDNNLSAYEGKMFSYQTRLRSSAGLRPRAGASYRVYKDYHIGIHASYDFGFTYIPDAISRSAERVNGGQVSLVQSTEVKSNFSWYLGDRVVPQLRLAYWF